jgi:predicted amidohydrolase
MGQRRAPQKETLFDLRSDFAEARMRVPSRRQFHLDWPTYDQFRPRRSTQQLVTLGLFQYAPQLRTVEANIAYLVEELEYVCDAILVLPEFFLSSYTSYRECLLERSTLAELLTPLASLSQANHLTLVGSLPVRKAGHDTNNVVIIQSGVVRFTLQDKDKLFGPEESNLSAGESRGKINISGLPTSIQICMDIVDPLPARRAVGDGARAILGPCTVSVDYLRTIHKARALENQVISVFCNRIGEEQDGTAYLGMSALFLPDGVALTASRATEQLLTATVDMDYIVGYTEKFGPRVQ